MGESTFKEKSSSFIITSRSLLDLCFELEVSVAAVLLVNALGSGAKKPGHQAQHAAGPDLSARGSCSPPRVGASPAAHE